MNANRSYPIYNGIESMCQGGQGLNNVCMRINHESMSAESEDVVVAPGP